MALSFRLGDSEAWKRHAGSQLAKCPLGLPLQNHRQISLFSNTQGQVQYHGREIFARMLCIPVVASWDGRDIAWTMTNNISDTVIRARNTYVLPEMRGRGVGRAILDYAISLWPYPWQTCMTLVEESNRAFYERAGFTAAAGFVARNQDFGWDQPVREFERYLPMVRTFNRVAQSGVARLPAERQAAITTRE